MLDDMVNEELETYDEYRRALSELIEESKTLRCVCFTLPFLFE